MPRHPPADGWGFRRARELHQLNDAGVGCARVAQEDRPQPIGFGAEQFRPVAGEVMVDNSVRPRPSRQNRSDRSTSDVQIAE